MSVRIGYKTALLVGLEGCDGSHRGLAGPQSLAGRSFSAMKRYTGQRALYEAWNSARTKPRRHGLLERLRPQLEKLQALRETRQEDSMSPIEPKAQPQVERRRESLKEFKPAPVTPERRRQAERPVRPQVEREPRLQPKPVQFNAGRIEVSVPYPIGILACLVLIAVMLVVFRIGQFTGKAGAGQVTQLPASTATSEATATVAASGAATQTGSNVIVIARHADAEQLRPLQAYFNEHGIETGIVSFARLREWYVMYGLDSARLPQGNGYLLVTTTAYDSLDVSGSEGYAAKQKIAEIGAGYKPQQGFDSFAPESFRSVYGLKIK
jgi:hypothetical protein